MERRAGRSSASGGSAPTVLPVDVLTKALAPPPRSDGRLRRWDYLVTAIEILSTDGVGALTTTNLCAQLNVTRGSLYHHFASGPALHAAVIDFWENELVPGLLAHAEAVADPSERIDVLKSFALWGDHNAEKAIRAWGATNPMVAAAVRRVDVAREQRLARMLEDAGVDPSRAGDLARIGFAILVGSQQFDDRIDRRRLGALLDEFERWVRSALSDA
ncbi:TetR/AcrR family transcriptional regulator [Desertimonas flava]|uniref:TetR/AcrR family transcriptional regulator n=1 Tax=Desertimonas flava TaxID=2064846 RepID=UPI0013C52005|nr:TetR/AcrR family transcriptional regulator [Desertimonas flava]